LTHGVYLNIVNNLNLNLNVPFLCRIEYIYVRIAKADADDDGDDDDDDINTSADEVLIGNSTALCSPEGTTIQQAYLVR